MAKNNRNTNIGVGLDTSGIAEGVAQITGALRGLTAEIGKIGASAQGSVEPVAQAFKKVHDTSGLAGAGVMAMSGIISDANYGMRGIANNLQQFSGLMVTLVTQTGSVTAAFKSLWSAMMGPLGVMLALSTGIALMERFSMQSDKTKEKTQELGNEFTEQKAEAAILFNELKNIVTSHTDINSAKRLAKEINDKYNTSLDTENVNLKNINGEYLILLKSLKASYDLKKTKESLDKAFFGEDQANAAIKSVKAQIQANKEMVKSVIADPKSDYADMIMANNKMLEDNLELQKQIDALELNKTKHIANQITLLKNAEIYQKSILKEDEKVKVKKINPVNVDASDLAKEALARDNKVFQEQKENAERQNEEMLDLRNFQIELNEQYWNEPIEYTGETFPKYKKGMFDDIKKLGDEIKANLQQHIISVFVSLGDMIGQAMVNGKDAFKQGGQAILGSFADFLGKFGALLIAYGVAHSAFWQSIKNPSPQGAALAIGAGIAAVAAAGAIKAYMSRQSQSLGGSSSSATPYTSSAGGYGGQNSEMVLYSRLDGRDIIISGQRAGYVNGR
jgi:hypothetical protein